MSNRCSEALIKCILEVNSNDAIKSKNLSLNFVISIFEESLLFAVCFEIILYDVLDIDGAKKHLSLLNFSEVEVNLLLVLSNFVFNLGNILCGETSANKLDEKRAEGDE